MIKVKDPDDPRRCEGVNLHGQCWHQALEGTTKCEIHGGRQAARKIEKKKTHDYQVQIYNERIEAFSDSERVKNLHGEIGVCRMTLESILNQCENPNLLLVHMPTIQSAANNIRGLVETMQRLEERNSVLLNRTQVQATAQRMLQVIRKHVTDAAVLHQIALEFENVLEDDARADGYSDRRS